VGGVEKPVPPDCLAWLVLFEASLKDPDNDDLARLAGQLLLDVLDDRGIPPPKGNNHAGRRLIR
jgi:hypothetical protein